MNSENEVSYCVICPGQSSHLQCIFLIIYTSILMVQWSNIIVADRNQFHMWYWPIDKSGHGWHHCNNMDMMIVLLCWLLAILEIMIVCGFHDSSHTAKVTQSQPTFSNLTFFHLKFLLLNLVCKLIVVQRTLCTFNC